MVIGVVRWIKDSDNDGVRYRLLERQVGSAAYSVWIIPCIAVSIAVEFRIEVPVIAEGRSIIEWIVCLNRAGEGLVNHAARRKYIQGGLLEHR